MSQPDPQNPYQSPQAYPAAASASMPVTAPKLEKLEYLRAYQYIFDNPQWTTVLLLGALMMIIPVVGPLVFLGYTFFVIDSLLQSQGTRYPVLDFNRFVDYLVRGVWPFLTALVVSLVIVPIMIGLWLLVVLIPMAIAGVGGEDAAPIAGIMMALLMVLMFVVVMVLSIGLNLFMIPLFLRAGLAQDFVEAFKFDWIKDFVRKMWLEMILVILFLMVSTIPMVLLGYLTCGIGFFFIQPIVSLAYGHLLYQLYSIFVTRGGALIVPKPSIKL